jgi:putative transposase
MKSKTDRRKPIRLKNFDYKGSEFVFFITICTANKQACFSNGEVAKIVIDEIEFRRIHNEVKVFCFCLMPDHLHVLLSLTENYQESLQNWVSAFKRYTSKQVNELFGVKPLWQKNFYDHVVRKDESLLKIAEYIVNNPVRKGLASDWQKYPYSRMVDPLPL